MKKENNIEQIFNIDPLLNDLNKVIQNGLNNLLKNYIDNYKLYEETHNCIMNLPSVKREIAKKSELNGVYDDLPDLISISSETDSSEINFSCYNNYNNYNRIPTQDESEEESEDTLLCMKKVVNKLLKEKEETIASYIEKEKSYKENYDKEIADLKDKINVLFEQNTTRYYLFYEQKTLHQNTIEKYIKEIDDLKNQLNSCVKQPLVCDLTDDNDQDNKAEELFDEPEQEVIEVKQEKENIILHIEETSGAEDEEEASEAEASESEVSESEDEDKELSEELDDEEDEEAAEDEVAIEDEEEENIDEVDEENDVEESEVDQLIEEAEEDVEEAELSEDEVETEKSDSEEDEEENKEKEEIVEDEEELIEIEIDGVTYCTENDDNGFIYELDNDGNVGETVGYLKNGEPFFN